MEIIKKIHYCWFGKKPLPEYAKKCIESWERHFPNYKIIEWNDYNYPINNYEFTKKAYNNKKYAFVSDFVRFDILYKYGGIFLDVDVEIIKPFKDLAKKGSFMALEEGTIDDLINLSMGEKHNAVFINPGLVIYAEPNLSYVKEILDFYKTLNFINDSDFLLSITSPKIVTNYFSKKKIAKKGRIGVCENKIYFYPTDYFNPLGSNRGLGTLNITSNTRSIHTYAASWVGDKEKSFYERMKKKKLKIGESKFLKFKNSRLYTIEKLIYLKGLLYTIKLIIGKIWRR